MVDREQVDREQAETARLDVLTFELGTRRCAIDIGWVREVLRFGPITAVAATPREIIGAMNVAGMVLPVVDLGLLLGEGETRPRQGDPGLRVADSNTQVVLSLGRVVEVARLRSAQPMRRRGRGAEAAGGQPDRRTVLTRVLTTEQGTLHLVDVSAALEEINQRVTGAVRRLREGPG